MPGPLSTLGLMETTEKRSGCCAATRLVTEIATAEARTTPTAVRRTGSILLRSLDGVDHQHWNHRFCGFELQPELLLNRGEDGRTVVVGRRTRTGIRVETEFARIPVEVDIVSAGQVSPVDDAPFDIQ